MIKNLLAKFGSKKVAGAVLVMATLLVGIGVISNFSDSQKAENDVALSRFNDNAFNNFNGSGVNRASLERQMSAQQNVNTARFLQSKNDQEYMDEDDAFSSDGAYAEGMNGDEGFVYGEGCAYGNGTSDPSNPMYVASAYDEDGNPITGYDENGNPIIGYDEHGNPISGRAIQGGAYGMGGAGVNGEDSAVGSVKGKGAKGKNKGVKGKNKNQKDSGTQLNRLAVSSSASPKGSSGSGSSANISAANIDTGTFRDTNKRELPQNNPNIKEEDSAVKAFRNGRGGSMGGFNVARMSGGVSSGKGDRGGGNAAMDLTNVAAYTNKAIQSKTVEGEKRLAMAGFEGSDDFIGATIEAGSSIEKVANNLLGGDSSGGFDGGGGGGVATPPPPTKDLQDQLKKLKKLKQDLMKRYLTLIFGTLGFFLAIAILVACNNIYTTIAAGVLTAAAAVFIAAQLWGGDWGIFDIIRKMSSDDLSDVNQGMDFGIKRFIAAFAGVACATIIGLAWSKGVQKVVKNVGEYFKNIGAKGSGTGTGTGTPQAADAMLNKSLDQQAAMGVANPSAPVNVNNLEPGGNPVDLGKWI